MLRAIYTVLLLGFLSPMLAQDRVKLDSLELELKSADSDTVRVKLMLDLVRYCSEFDYVQAAHYAKEAKELSHASGNEVLELKSDRALAGVYFNVGDYKLASNHFFNALRYYEKAQDSSGVSLILINLGAVYDRLQEFDKALEFYMKAQTLLNSSHLDPVVKVRYLTSLYNNVANVYQTKSEFESARQYYEKALTLARESDNKTLEGITLNNLGKLYTNDLQEMEKGFDYLIAGLKVRKEVGNKNELAKSYLQLTTFYLKQQNLPEAERAARMAVNLGKEVSSLEVQKEAYFGLSQVQEAMGNYKASLEANKEYSRFRDSVQQQMSGSELARLQLQYDFEKAEQEGIQEQNKIRTRFTIAIIILAAGFIIAVLLVLTIRARARQTELKQKNLKQDVDIKNKELTTNVMYLIRKNELINNVAERLLVVKKGVPPETEKIVHDIILDLQREADSDTWKEFEMRFNQVHNDFYNKLRQLHPGLSPSDEKLCAFLRLNMSSKEIAAITKQHIKSVEVSRTRLRKKLNLTNTTSNLVTYLMNL